MNLLEYLFLPLQQVVLEERLPDRSRLTLPAKAEPIPAMAEPIPEPELPTDYWPQERVPVPLQLASLVLEYDFELVDPSDWHRLAAERLYPGLGHPSDFARRPVQAVVASLVRVLRIQASHPNLLVHLARWIQVCRSLA